MNNSFKPIFRSLLNSKQFQNEKCLKVWIWCLLKATDNPFNAVIDRQVISLKQGQFVYGVIKASEELNMPQSTVRSWMQWLRKIGSISIEPTNKFSIITITNDAVYREMLSEAKNKRITDEQQMNTYNKNKKEKEPYTVDFEDFWSKYPRHEGKRSAFSVWEKIKPSEKILSKILEQVVAQSHSKAWRKDDGQYVPAASKWLEEARWEDDVVNDSQPRSYMIGWVEGK